MTDAPNTVTFISSHQPPLPAGDYVLQVSQTVTNTQPTGADDTFDETFVNSHTFAVLGDRFSLDPTSIQSLFPPPDARGEFGNVLAHAVLNRRALPWIRSPRLVADDSLPWLAILVFAASEAPTPVPAALGDLARAPFVHKADGSGTTAPSSLPDATLSYPDAYAQLPVNSDTGEPPPFELEWGQAWSDPCTVIDVNLSLFASLVPTAADLAWLGHARQVSMVKKAGVDDHDVPGDFSVVVANRLPGDGTSATAHVVCLEGMAPLLPGSGIATPAGANGATATAIRLVSLAHWAFSATSGETFSQYLERLDMTVAGPQRQAPGAGAGADAAVTTAFGLGYTALTHTTRVGDATASWYRGPLLPYRTQPVIVPTPSSSAQKVIERADEALRYDPDTGLFDVSYAAAWQLGRNLALGSSSFSASLYEYKRTAAQAVTASVAGAHLREQLLGDADVSDGAAPGASPRRLAAPDPALAARRITALLAEGVEHRLGHDDHRSRAPAATRSPLAGRRSMAQAYAAAARDPGAVRAAVSTVAPPADVVAWLSGLALLKGLPFSYLVPDETMVPKESIRFFSVDLNWINALLEGALSIGRSSSADLTRDAALAEQIYAAVAPPAIVSGVLLRSAVIDGWPGLEVTAYDTAGAEITTPALRFERLAPSVLLYLTAAELSRVDIHEPAEGIHFGADLDGPDKELRYITVPATAPANTVPGDAAKTLTAPMKQRSAGATGVVDIDAFAGQAGQVLSANGANNDPAMPAGQALPFTSAELALQLVEGVQSVTFSRTVS